MTVEELRKAAKELGYNIIPIKKYEKFLPCTCGCNRREHWSGSYDTVILKCANCGKEVTGNSDADARHNWNLTMTGEL